MAMRLIGIVAALLVLASLTGVVLAHGVSPAKLGNAGWTCFNVPGLGVHCFPPGFSAADETITVSVFDTNDPADTHGDFLGTELLIRSDLYHGQPCPQNHLEDYELLPAAVTGLGADYYACHHYETGH